MKRGILCLLGLALAATASGWSAEPAPRMVDCDLGKAVTFEETRSPDGRYVVAWSIIPTRPQAPPFPWKSSAENGFWDVDSPDVAIVPEEIGSHLYRVADYVLDTQTGKTLELPSARPDFKGKNRGYLAAAWKIRADQTGYALIQNDARFYTANLWIVQFAKGRLTQVDLSNQLNSSVEPVLVKKSPIAWKDYGIAYPLDGAEGTHPVLGEKSAQIPFTAEIPKSLNVPAISGTITVSLAKGHAITVQCDAPEDNPFASDRALHAADQRLNAAYARLLRSQSPAGQLRLRAKQRQWIAQRDEDAMSAVRETEPDDDAGWKQVRNQHLLENTLARTRELETQLNQQRNKRPIP